MLYLREKFRREHPDFFDKFRSVKGSNLVTQEDAILSQARNAGLHGDYCRPTTCL